ncbi:MAG: MBL fold metallo-hydrolase [Acidaminococcaceae bacterium]|nr:MBL fold metallo-hydrolase [Acidaminococcaceae bacterium]
MDRQLLYVHEIIPIFKTKGENKTLPYQVVLLPYDEDANSELKFENLIREVRLGRQGDSDYSVGQRYKKYGQKHIYEGCFVRLNDKGTIENVNGDPDARRKRLAINVLRAYIAGMYREPDNKRGLPVSGVRSYHINVGHGNTSIIAFRFNDGTHLWMIDCAGIEIGTWKKYEDNITACFEHIKKAYNMSAEPKIDKLLITHPHYDHISSAAKLITKNKLVPGAEIWLNRKFSFPSGCYKNFLQIIKANENKLRLIEPLRKNSTANIRVWYPDFIIKGTKSETVGRAPDGKVNNASVVYNIHLGGKSMVFPGDIETAGWNLITDCKPCDGKADYYCVSHHGSLTGHLRTVCPVSRNISDIACCTNNMSKAILMGRDGVYNGIIHQEVRKCFGPRLSITTDMNGTSETKFLELDWAAGSVTRY